MLSTHSITGLHPQPCLLLIHFWSPAVFWQKGPSCFPCYHLKAEGECHLCDISHHVITVPHSHCHLHQRQLWLLTRDPWAGACGHPFTEGIGRVIRCSPEILATLLCAPCQWCTIMTWLHVAPGFQEVLEDMESKKVTAGGDTTYDMMGKLSFMWGGTFLWYNCLRSPICLIVNAPHPMPMLYK